MENFSSGEESVMPILNGPSKQEKTPLKRGLSPTPPQSLLFPREGRIPKEFTLKFPQSS